MRHHVHDSVIRKCAVRGLPLPPLHTLRKTQEPFRHQNPSSYKPQHPKDQDLHPSTQEAPFPLALPTQPSLVPGLHMYPHSCHSPSCQGQELASTITWRRRECKVRNVGLLTWESAPALNPRYPWTCPEEVLHVLSRRAFSRPLGLLLLLLQ
jgi:hypothetical protein